MIKDALSYWKLVTKLKWEFNGTTHVIPTKDITGYTIETAGISRLFLHLQDGSSLTICDSTHPKWQERLYFLTFLRHQYEHNTN